MEDILLNFNDYKIKDINLANKGKLLVELAELDMPGLIELRKKYSQEQPLSGARIAGCLNMTVQTAVFIITLRELGAEVRWCSSNSQSTQDEAAAYIAAQEIPVYAWKGQTSREYEKCIEATFFENKTWWPNLFLDDGGDLVKLAHEKYSEFLPLVKGITEETTSGIALYKKWFKANELKLPVINVNDAPTKQKFDNFYGCRESFIDGLKRATDLMIGGKVAVVSGYGYVGKGCAKLLRDYGARVYVTEVDPISALQAVIDGFEVKQMSEITSYGDIFVTATGNIEVIGLNDMLNMKNGAILCNMGHRDVEVNMSELHSIPKSEIKPLVDLYDLPNGKKIIVLGQGKDVNLACATGHPDFVMSISLTNQTLALMMLHKNYEGLESNIYDLPRTYDELNATIHLHSMGVSIDLLNDEQYRYMGIEKGEQLKSNNYYY
ncbi:adenosylhomocysteinase [Evansella caseinilytica]|uniref:Adenosylhomocysteinase n=1 Tax=Evansella caseinilytica TaxID=1503961 RepID=A0A1H3LAC3_9BACI|nr:adenosylhomocysteinase [Evansella caseinilytica]SDY61393.1 adenosylhomocysteinase [Evansella caseinilytica]